MLALVRSLRSQFATLGFVFLSRNLECEVVRKAFPITPEFLVQAFGRYTVNARQIRIEHDL